MNEPNFSSLDCNNLKNSLMIATVFFPQHIFALLFLPSEVQFLLKSENRWKWKLKISEYIAIILHIIVIVLSSLKLDTRDFYHFETLSFITTLLILIVNSCKQLDNSIFITTFWAFQLLVSILKISISFHLTWANGVENLFVILIVVLNLYSNVYAKANQTDIDTSKTSPEYEVNLIRRLYFQWFNGLNELANGTELNEGNTWQLDERMKCENLLKDFLDDGRTKITKGAKYYENVPKIDDENGKRKKSITINYFVIFRPFIESLIKTGFLRLLLNLMFFVCPYILRLILRDHSSSFSQPYTNQFYVMLLFIISIIISFVNSQYLYHTTRIGLKIKSILMGLIYKKSLQLKQTTNADVTLISIETNRFVDLLPNIHMIWSIPITIIICLAFLWQILGISTIAGVLTLLLTIAATYVIGLRLKTLQNLQMNEKDNRINLTNEIIGNIKHIKFYCWEEFFMGRVMSHRHDEIRILEQIVCYDALKYLIGVMAPFLVSVSSFATFLLIDDGNLLTLDIVFVSIALFHILRYPLSIFPTLVTSLIATSNSIDRINNFLQMGEFKRDEAETQYDTEETAGDHAVSINDGNFSQHDDKCLLKNINLRIKRKSFVAVVGSVGSGKSSLLLSILGELNRTKGSININGKIAYVPQESWILNRTFKENVLFGKSFDEKLYKSTIDGCELLQDIEMLPNGHETIIGEKGITLSGGQKQRISLARAIYSDKDVYLLDDPLSSVDNKVADLIFNKIMSKSGILGDKTRMLVTSNVKYLELVDEIIVLKDGEVLDYSPWNVICESVKLNIQEHVEKIDQFNLEAVKVAINIDTAKKAFLKNAKIDNKSQAVPNTYFYYLRHFGITAAIAILAFSILSPVFEMLSTIYLSKTNSNSTFNESFSPKDYMLLYFLFGMLQSIVLAFQSYMLARFGLKVAKILHESLLKTTIYKLMEFFDATPSGQILTRFSQDIDVLDNKIIGNTKDFLLNFFTVLAVLVLFCLTTKSLTFFVILVIICAIYVKLLIYHLNVSRQLKRLEASTKSPILSHFNESKFGRVSIRAYEQQDLFIKDFMEKTDNHQRFSYFHTIATRWFGVRLELIGSVVIFFVTLLAIHNKDEIGISFIGVVVSYALRLIQYLNQLFRITAQVENDVISFERISRYLNEKDLPTENEKLYKLKQRKINWPKNGKIEFENFSMNYSNGCEILSKINVTINAGEKIGIIGRTGAGKSSLINSLFRLHHHTEGTIKIDGVNIADIPLNQLREAITVIPQNPTIFSETIRMNLDPLNRHNDLEILTVLEECRMKDFISKLPYGMNSKICQSGDDISLGQKQLLCLARGLLKNTKIVILDEATSTVDLDTESVIQTVIMESFKECTVLTVAHRIGTIIDSDKILLLDNGTVSKFDTPESFKLDKKLDKTVNEL